MNYNMFVYVYLSNIKSGHPKSCTVLSRTGPRSGRGERHRHLALAPRAHLRALRAGGRRRAARLRRHRPGPVHLARGGAEARRGPRRAAITVKTRVASMRVAE